MVPDNSLPYGLDYMETLSLEVPVVSQPVPDPSQPLPGGSMEAGNGVEPGNDVEPGDDMEVEYGKPRKLTLFSQDPGDAPIPVPFHSLRIVYYPPLSRRMLLLLVSEGWVWVISLGRFL